VTAVIAPQQPEAFDVIRRRCQEVNLNPITAGESGCDYYVSSVSADDGCCCATFETPDDRYQKVILGLRGRHQVTNAAVALALSESLRERGFAITHPSIVRGLETAVHPGRLEWWSGQPSILFDGAHNPAAARALKDYLDEFVPNHITVVFGAMKDKRLGEMAEALAPKANRLVLTQLDNPRAASLDQLATAVPAWYEKDRLLTAASVREALQIAMERTPGEGLVCVTGSLYLVGAAQHVLSQNRLR
jgi:dihydrofolate synthase/folylpolyglutamate synthase